MGSLRAGGGQQQQLGLNEPLLSRKHYSEFGTASAYTSGQQQPPPQRKPWTAVADKARGLWSMIEMIAEEGYKMGKSDPRKMIFAAKAGLALALVSLLIFFNEPLKSISSYSIWAIMTVVVVFEFSIGATFNKGLNRAMGTVSAGALSVGVGQLSALSGQFEEPIIIICIFIAGSCATFAKLHPKMKDYEYGFRVFLLTYCIVLVSNSSSGNFFDTALTRLLLIAVGATVALVVNTCVYPIWAGEDLHKLVVKNFRGLATSLEGCVDGYIQCVAYERVPSKILTYQALDDPMYSGYQSTIQSASQEETLMGFAVWEPPHGRYNRWKYPWQSFVMLSGALRHCAFMVMAMHGCILSEIQAPADLRQEFSNEIKLVGIEGAKVLRLLGDKVEKMEKLNHTTILKEVHTAAEDLQLLIDHKSYLFVKSETWPIEELQSSRPPSSTDPYNHNHHEEINLLEKAPIQTPSDLAALDELKSSPDDAVLGLRKWETQIGVDMKWPMSDVDTHHGIIRRMTTWPSRMSEDCGGVSLLNEREVKTFESASTLSVSTFTSQLVEFVARLRHLVDAFKELEEKAGFKEVVESEEEFEKDNGDKKSSTDDDQRSCWKRVLCPCV